MSMLRVRRSVALLVAVAATAVLPASASAVVGGIGQAERYPVNEFDVVSGLGAKWVRMYFDWSAGQPNGPTPGNVCSGLDSNVMNKFGERVDGYAAKGVGVNVQLMFTPTWANGSAGKTVPPTNSADYGNFAECLGRTFPKVTVWEVWNEPNDKIFWHNGPNAAKYAEVLKAGYAGFKRGNPSARVLIGGLVANDFHFLEELYEHGAKGYFDGIDLHVDTACLVREPGFYYREPDGRIGKSSFTGYREVRAKMLDHGDDKPIWMEIGWGTRTEPCTTEGVTEKRPSGVPPETQARFLREAYACLAADTYVETGIWFSLMDVAKSDRYDHWLGLMDSSGVPKPSFTAFQSIWTGAGPTPNPSCGAKLDRDLPSATIKVPSQYFTRFTVEGTASDATTPIRKIELWVDGKRIEGMNVEGATYRKDWFGSTNLSLGKHTVELRAFDEALNVGIAKAEVTKVDPRRAARTVDPRVTFTARKKAGRRILIKARVLKAIVGDFTEQPKGRMQIFVERKNGRKWTPTSRFTKGIAKRIVIGYKAKKPGKWRVWARLAVDAPYKNVRTKYFQFKL